MPSNKWSGRKVTTARAKLAYLLPAPCYRCGVTIPSAAECKELGIGWDVDHIRSRSEGGIDQLTNYAVSHSLCNRRHGQKLSTQSKAKTQSVRAAEAERTHKFWSLAHARIREFSSWLTAVPGVPPLFSFSGAVA